MKAARPTKVPSGLVLKKLGEVGLEPCCVGLVDGTDIVMVQRSQCVAVLFWFPHRDPPTP